MEAPSETLLEHWPGVFFRQRPDLTFASASPRLAEFTGIPLVRWFAEPELFWKVVHESDAEEYRLRLARVAGVPAGFTSGFRLRHALTGRIACISEFRRPLLNSAGKLEGYEGYWIDETRLSLSEKRLAAAAWKETLALVTMGLTHDFNNVLAGILGLSETFLAQTTPDHLFHEGLVLMQRKTREAAQIVQRITQLHQAKTGTRSYQDLNTVVTETAELIRKIVPKHLDFTRELAPVPLPVHADATELQQVIINLARNAAEAMPQRGRLTFRTSLHEELAPCDYAVGARPRLPAVCLTVTDTGVGIAPENLGSIFEPFFTTKPAGKGAGLGLYNTRLFAENHHGAISVQSVQGAGTTVQLWLPQSDFTEAEGG